MSPIFADFGSKVWEILMYLPRNEWNRVSCIFCSTFETNNGQFLPVSVRKCSALATKSRVFYTWPYLYWNLVVFRSHYEFLWHILNGNRFLVQNLTNLIQINIFWGTFFQINGFSHLELLGRFGSIKRYSIGLKYLWRSWYIKTSTKIHRMQCVPNIEKRQISSIPNVYIQVRLHFILGSNETLASNRATDSFSEAQQ